jgi:4-hydroxyacetophenone monooxygenase
VDCVFDIDLKFEEISLMEDVQTRSQTSSLVPEQRPKLSDDDLRTALGAANVPTLLMVVYQFTGDEKWLGERYQPTRAKGLEDHDTGGLSEDVQEEVREAGFKAIKAMQEGEAPAIPTPSPELAVRMMRFMMAERVEDAYGPLLATEVARRTDAVLAEPDEEQVAPPTGFRVAVIGTGVGGIVAARHLEQMGIEYELFEKNPQPGGTWWQNNYPGAGVDVPSHLYSFSFAKNDWTLHFERRDSLQRYFSEVAETLDHGDEFRYETEVLSARLDEERMKWGLEVRNPDGSTENCEFDAVIAAVGSINRPRLPDIPGIDSFEGESAHSAQWPQDLDLAGKRVVVVGTGASAMQIVPAVVEEVEHMTIIQRSPGWIAPHDKFMQPIRPELRELLKSCDMYQAWYWTRLLWQMGDKVIDALRVDPEWEHPDRSLNRRNDGHREYFKMYLEEQLEGRPDLIEKTLPDYPPYGKRILLDNGWFPVLKRDDVELVADRVTEVTPGGVVVSSGEAYDADVIIWATGFDTYHFVGTLDVIGKGGQTIREAWPGDEPRGYLGVGATGFPNFLMLGGPNSFPGSGSFMYFIEVQMRYLRRLLTQMFKQDIKAIEPKLEATDDYNQRVDDLHAVSVWTHPKVQSYYRNSKGRVIYLMPFRNLEYWEMTEKPDLENYELTR